MAGVDALDDDVPELVVCDTLVAVEDEVDDEDEELFVELEVVLAFVAVVTTATLAGAVTRREGIK